MILGDFLKTPCHFIKTIEDKKLILLVKRQERVYEYI